MVPAIAMVALGLLLLAQRAAARGGSAG